MKGYDYSHPGLYFVTVVIHNRLPLLGGQTSECIIPSPAGRMIEQWWQKLPEKFQGLDLDEFILMPEHIHGIVSINGADAGGKSINLTTVLQWWKTMTTNDYIQSVNHDGWPPFEGRLWQRSFYERIIRSESELRQIREYIKYNPISGMERN